ncbi:MAG: hypothetical protein CMC18_07920 [Flavobacteriaceae bacterium]|nr:hypothetical protein [Flavobacteriaceae bacterium]|tara:strand:- start:56774 stop:56995 length:222 start_codon:yes stop_codon:yes gene_type:complete
MKKQQLRMIILLVLTLGLAPYSPEPHLFGKIRWVISGAVGMKPMDWFDLVLHGFPFILLLAYLVLTVCKKESS